MGGKATRVRRKNNSVALEGLSPTELRGKLFVDWTRCRYGGQVFINDYWNLRFNMVLLRLLRPRRFRKSNLLRIKQANLDCISTHGYYELYVV